MKIFVTECFLESRSCTTYIFLSTSRNPRMEQILHIFRMLMTQLSNEGGDFTYSAWKRKMVQLLGIRKEKIVVHLVNQL